MRILILLLLMSSTAFADIYVVSDKNTCEIVSISNENDCVLKPNMKLDIVKGKDLKDVAIIQSPNMYKLENGAIKINHKKVADTEKQELKNYKKTENDKLIKQELRDMAIQSLRAKGITIEEE